MASHKALVLHVPRQDDKPAGRMSWWIWHHPCEDEGVGPFVLFECPDGHVSTMHHLHTGHGHSIDANGQVSPSSVCPREGCSFHQYVILQDWQPILTA